MHLCKRSTREVDIPPPARDKSQIVVCLERLDLPFQLPWQEGVIRIEKSDVLSLRSCEAAIPGASEAMVILPNHSNARVANCDQNIRCVVRGPIVDDHHFEVLKSLFEYASDRGFQEARRVIGWDDDADDGRRYALAHVSTPSRT